MIKDPKRRDVNPHDLLVEPTIKVDSQEVVAGAIKIEARPTGRNVPRGIISIGVSDEKGAAIVHFLPRHAREIATTLLAIADKVDQFPTLDER